MRDNFINHKKYNYVKSEWGEMIRTPKEGLFFAETENGVKYTKEELNLFSRQSLKISKQVNSVKEIIGGEVVSVEYDNKR